MQDPIWVSSLNGRYPIYVGENLLAQPSLLRPLLAGKQAFILSHPDIARHYLPRLIQTCLEAGANQTDHLLLPAGDHYKTLSSAEKIWSTLLEHHHHRDTTIIALGGGMIGDLAGFSAACYLRGVNLIQIPTSLLAQIDAAIGGKTAVNHPRGKNMIGAFHSPQLVLCDLATLATLSEREFNAGLAELIKYGLAVDAALFYWLEAHMAQLCLRDPATLERAIHWACSLKAQVVTADEMEKGHRIILNFGHTIGHALESLLDYKLLLHGEAVALGMLVATQLSIDRGLIKLEILDRLVNLLKVVGLSRKLPQGLTSAAILAKMKSDKKHMHQKLHWVLLKAIGQAHVCHEVTLQQIVTALRILGAKVST